MTVREISTISYNTEPFLVAVLNSLVKQGYISHYYYIYHTGEHGDKDHFHVYMFPLRRIDLGKLREMFMEFDPNKPDKPLCIMAIYYSDAYNWIMYAIHDKIYCIDHKTWGEDGKIEYSIDDIKTNMLEQLQRDYRIAPSKTINEYLVIMDYIEHGRDATTLISSHGITPYKINQVYTMFLLQKKACIDYPYIKDLVFDKPTDNDIKNYVDSDGVIDEQLTYIDCPDKF